MRKIAVHTVVATAMLVFAVGILASGGRVEVAWLRLYSYAVVASLAALTLWNLWLWRLPVMQRFPAVPPDLRGTWQGTLQSAWVDEDGNTPPAKQVFLVIRQTATSLSAILLSDESRSESLMAQVSGTNGAANLTFTYQNTPQLSMQRRSRIHCGTTSLRVHGSPATRLRGHYWTSRNSQGELDFKDRLANAHDDFDSATHDFSSNQA